MIDEDSDHDVDRYLQKMSLVLEQCKSYSTNEFNLEQNENLAKYGSIFFMNIDGNKSNFDSLAVELDRFSHKFPIIGLAETNVNESESPVYQLGGYNSFYQDKFEDKSKGSGVALYIHESLIAVKNEFVSRVTKI